MAEYRSVALVTAHQPIPAMLNYGISDLTELCGLAAFIRDVVDDVAIPVGPADRDPLAGFAAFMKRRRPQLVGISAFTCGAKTSLEYARIAKQYGAFVVLGSYHASAQPEQMLLSPNVDAVGRGEGELTLRELVRNGPSTEVLGLSFKDNGRIVHNPERPVIEDLDTLPMPLREIRPPRFGLDGLSYHVDSIFTSRGCRGKCTFCANHLVGKKWRERSTAHVLRELESITPSRGAKPKLVKLWDANFMTNTARTAELCEQIIASGCNTRFRFVAETRIEDILRGKEILPLMKEAGFERLGAGVESPNRETLRLVQKGLRPEAVEEASRLVSETGIFFSKFYIIGHPNESVEDILQYPDVALSQGLPRQSAFFFIMTPYPGTQVHADYSEKGLIKSDDWDLYTNYGAVIEPDGMSQSTLQSLLGTVAIQYSINKRFAKHEPFRKLVFKLLSLAVATAKVFQGHQPLTREQQEGGVWETLTRLQADSERPTGMGRPRRFLLTGTLRLFHNDQEPVVLRLSRQGATDRLTVGQTADPGSGSGPTFNLSVRHLYRLAQWLEPGKLGHDVITLILKPSAMKPRWFVSLLWRLARLTPLLAAMGLFDLQKRLSR